MEWKCDPMEERYDPMMKVRSNGMEVRSNGTRIRSNGMQVTIRLHFCPECPSITFLLSFMLTGCDGCIAFSGEEMPIERYKTRGE